MKVICKAYREYVQFPYFTAGKVYTAHHHVNALYRVIDDLGHERFIIPGARCPHLVHEITEYPGQAVGGQFDIVKGDL